MPQTIEEESDFFPFGGEISVIANGGNTYKFTGKERDAETGFDYFGARYYGNSMGRWLSPDWAGAPTEVPYADFGNPQSLNLYGYVGNNPIGRADADGHETQATLDPEAALEAGSDFEKAVNWLGKALDHPAVQAFLMVLPFEGGAEEAAVEEQLAIGAGRKAESGAGKAVRPAENPNEFEPSDSNINRMEDGKPPIGKDGHPLERHHPNGDPANPPETMTKTEHRLGENYKRNHPDTNKEPSRIDRKEAAGKKKQRSTRKKKIGNRSP